MDNEKGLSIEINQAIAKGTYSNLTIIAHSRNEFVIDFVSKLPGYPKGQITDRMILSPETAKRFLLALQDNIGKYEANFGQINLGEPKATFNLSDFGKGNGTKS